MTGWSKEHDTMLDDCMRREEVLTEWEQQFLDGLDHRLRHGKTPTEKQTAVLDRIWDRVTT